MLFRSPSKPLKGHRSRSSKVCAPPGLITSADRLKRPYTRQSCGHRASVDGWPILDDAMLPQAWSAGTSVGSAAPIRADRLSGRAEALNITGAPGQDVGNRVEVPFRDSRRAR